MMQKDVSMAVIIVTHPHGFDNGLLKEKLPTEVRKSKIPVYFVPDGDKRPYGGTGLYDDVLKPAKGESLKNYGRASLQDEDAKKIVEGNSKIYLAGGNLSECLASTYNSLIRAAEREGVKFEVLLVQDLIYLQAKKSGTVATLETLREEAPEHLERYLKMFDESDNVVNSWSDSSEVT